MCRVCVSVMLFAAAGSCAAGVMSGAQITTAVSCSFYGQPTVSEPNSCSIEQQSSAPDDRGYATAASSAGFVISGNVLTLSFSQNMLIQEGGFATPSYSQFTGNAAASGSVGLELETTGSGTGYIQVLISSLIEVDPAGENWNEIGFSLAGFSDNCQTFDGLYDTCFFSPYPTPDFGIPFQMGSILDFSMGDSSYGFVDPDHNPLSAANGTTEYEFVFRDANGYPVNIAEVPEPGTIEFALIGALVAGLLGFARKRWQAKVARKPAHRGVRPSGRAKRH